VIKEHANFELFLATENNGIQGFTFYLTVLLMNKLETYFLMIKQLI